jgi:hypothetical protein
MSDWLKRAEASLDDGMYGCPECSNKFPFIQLKDFKGRRLCPQCIKNERERAKKAAEAKPRQAPQPQIDIAAIGDIVKDAVAGAMRANMSQLEASVARIGDEVKKNAASKPAGQELYLPGTPTEHRLFFELCKNKRLVGGNIERSFGMHQASLVHIRLVSMWHDNLIWKDGHGWFMINPELTKPQLEMGVGVPLKQDEYDDYMKEIIGQAINFKFRPFSMLSDRKQKELEREIAILGPGK